MSKEHMGYLSPDIDYDLFISYAHGDFDRTSAPLRSLRRARSGNVRAIGIDVSVPRDFSVDHKVSLWFIVIRRIPG